MKYNLLNGFLEQVGTAAGQVKVSYELEICFLVRAYPVLCLLGDGRDGNKPISRQ